MWAGKQFVDSEEEADIGNRLLIRNFLLRSPPINLSR
jgi:hypothetical protein